MIRSATRISLLVLIVSLPVLVWFGKVPAEVFTDTLKVVIVAFFAIKGIEGSSQPK